MKVTPINDYKDIHQDKETVLVLGYFDALHRGHKVLFDKARQIADEKQLEVAVLTFNESPQLTFNAIRMISFCISQHLRDVVIFLKPMAQINFT